MTQNRRTYLNIDSCIADSEENPDNIEELAKELKFIYPKSHSMMESSRL